MLKISWNFISLQLQVIQQFLRMSFKLLFLAVFVAVASAQFPEIPLPEGFPAPALPEGIPAIPGAGGSDSSTEAPAAAESFGLSNVLGMLNKFGGRRGSRN